MSQLTLDRALGKHEQEKERKDDHSYGAVAPSAGMRPGVMRCEECGRLVPDSLYCLNCGAPLLVKEMHVAGDAS